MKRLVAVLLIAGCSTAGTHQPATTTTTGLSPTLQASLLRSIDQGMLGAHNDSVAILAYGKREPKTVRALQAQRRGFVKQACSAATVLNGKVPLPQATQDFLDSECP